MLNTKSPRSVRRWILALVVAIVGLPAAKAWGEELLIVYRGTAAKEPDSLAWLDPEGYGVLQQVKVGRKTVAAMEGPEGRFLYLLAEGKAGKGTLTVVDLWQRAVVAEHGAGASPGLGAEELGPWMDITGDGRHLVTLKSRNQLLIVDRDGHTGAAVAYLRADAEAVALSPEGKLAYVLTEKKKAARNPSLLVVDLQARKVLRTLDMGVGRGLLFSSPDRQHVYALATGPSLYHPKSKKKAQLFILDGTSGEEKERLNLGFQPVALFNPETGLLLLANDRGPELSNELRWIQDGAVQHKVLLRGESAGLAPGPEAGQVFVWADDGLRLMDRNDPKRPKSFPLSFYPGTIRSDPARGLAFVKSSVGSKVAILDLEKGTVKQVIKTGREGVRAAKMLPKAALFATTGIFLHSLQTLTMGTDGRALHVLNPASNDVTSIDIENGEVLTKIGVGSNPYDLQITPNGDRILVSSSRRTTVIDTRTQEAVAALTAASGTSKPRLPPLIQTTSRRVLVPIQHGFSVLSLEDGKVLASKPHFKEPRLLLEIEGPPQG